MSDLEKSREELAKRSNSEEIDRAHRIVLNETMFTAAMNTFPDVVVVLDHNRQVIYANERLLEIMGCTAADVVGKRPGEVFRCVHSDNKSGGCGTTQFCRECGALKAIVNAQLGEREVGECRLFVKSAEGEDVAMDFRVSAVPIVVDATDFIVFVIKNIADEKRRESLEKTFFHDILNELGILVGFSENARDGFVPMEEKTIDRILQYARRVVGSIQAQRDMLAAEEGELVINVERILVSKFLEDLVAFISNTSYARRHKFTLACDDVDEYMHTDTILLKRVLINLLRNAVEATEFGAEVNIKYCVTETRHVFSVHSAPVMSEDVKLQVFNRSFSTKGKGRGLGTYGVKLFTEQYLNGKVSFESEEGKGTTFFLCFDI